jgi:hypothetical protein
MLHGYFKKFAEAGRKAVYCRAQLRVNGCGNLPSGMGRVRCAAALVPFFATGIRVLMQRHGLHVLFQKPMWFDAFYISLLSSKYKNGRTNWIGALGSGMRSNVSALMANERSSSLLYIISL